MEISRLSWVSRRIVNLARVFVSVKRVMRKDAPWASRDERALPQYTTRNVVCYPQDPDAALKTVCVVPKDLVQILTVQFVGSDPKVVLSREPSLEVNLEELRAALYWLVTHNWCWLEATRGHGRLLLHALGPVLEDVLDKYRHSLQHRNVGVPREIMQTATELREQHVTGTNLGPADAVPAGLESFCPEAEHGPSAAPETSSADPQLMSGIDLHDQSHMTASRARQALDSSLVIIDPDKESLTPLQCYTRAMRQYGVLQECAGQLEVGVGDAARRVGLRDNLALQRWW